MTRILGSTILSYFSDLLPLRWPATQSEVVIFVCRLLGCTAIIGIAAASILHAGAIPVSQEFPFGLLVLTVAMAVGYLIKEVAILIGGIAINWLGRPFLRARLTISGARMNELYRPDGTWDRYTYEASVTIHVWSELNGGCHREVLPYDTSGSAFANHR